MEFGKREAASLLTHLLDCVVDLTGCSDAMLVAWTDGRADIISSVGVPLSARLRWNEFDLGTKWQRQIVNEFEVQDALNDPWLQDEKFIQDVAKWRYVANSPLLTSWSDTIFTIMCCDPVPGKMREQGFRLKILSRLADVCANELSLLLDFSNLMDDVELDKIDSSSSAFFQDNGQEFVREIDDRNIVSDFLMNTLINDRRLLRRKEIEYLAVYKWRKTIKAEQIKAMRAIKAYGSTNLEQQMAVDLAQATTRLHGTDTVKIVTNVPCGHSGKKCLISRVAPLVAEQLDLPYSQTFASLPSAGSSHPKTNLSRPRMRLIKKPSVPILLLDDIATSGRHIEEAATLLRKYSSTVLPIVWLAG
ncbi:hypothetical protein [Sphingorhabdus sp. EL138]|uniref:hypothetical protein n=1 Tax=Sphingorhabdus sp. EL138 TaxID=2073156 RepID=UPI0013A559B0|nr:hypothetical protein [Sphingorhabdus sp. EL138]